MIEQTLTKAKSDMQLILGALRDQLKTLQVGRASSSLVDGLKVEHYGSEMPLNQLASITIPEANQILIAPWDKGALGAIEKAVRASDLGVNPVNDGNAVRIILPPLTEERRRELAKVVGKMAEEARIAMRNVRREAWDTIQASQKEGKLTEDDRDRGREQLDKAIDDMNRQVDDVTGAKEQEMMSL